MQETRDPTIKLFGQAIPLPGDADRHSPPPFHVHKQEEEGGDDEYEGEQQPQQEDKDQTHEVRLLIYQFRCLNLTNRVLN